MTYKYSQSRFSNPKFSHTQTRTTNKTLNWQIFRWVSNSLRFLTWNPKFSHGYVVRQFWAKLQINSGVILTCGKHKIVFVVCLELNSEHSFPLYNILIFFWKQVFCGSPYNWIGNNVAPSYFFLSVFFFPYHRSTVDIRASCERLLIRSNKYYSPETQK